MVSYSNVRVEGREEYRFLTGEYPRGRGNWGFKIGKDTYWPGPTKLFTDAKIAAQKEAVKRGETSIRILP